MKHVPIALAMMLAACSPEQPDAKAPPSLERSAIARGLVVPEGGGSAIGLFAREGDRLCVVGDDRLRLGVVSDNGTGGSCSGSGSARSDGERLAIDLGGGCRFDASFDGRRIRFPGAVPDACSARCSGRASFAGVYVERVSDAASEAATLRDPRGRALCAG